MKVAKLSTYLMYAGIISLIGMGCSCTGLHSDGGHPLKLDRCADIPPGSLPDPVGDHLHRFTSIQRDNAVAIQYAVFLHEWYLGGLQLGPYGEYHLASMIRRLPTVPYPVLIQPTPDPNANEARRQIIVAKLAAAGIRDPEARVIIANPQAEGLFGDEAPRVYQRLLLGSYGMGFGGGFGGFGGGFGGGGFGGGFPGGAGGAGTFLPPLVGGGMGGFGGY
ncbi:MAG TPA: hypothetical protein VFE62_14130 [Gemmataceae bacterium]|nr:hypothetical protein [Gemmataceae bacterium]